MHAAPAPPPDARALAPARGRARGADAAAARRRPALSRCSARPNCQGSRSQRGASAAAGQRSIAELVAQVEAHLEQQSGGRPRLGGARRRSICGSAASTMRSRRAAMRCGCCGATAEREADLGEALTGAAERHRHRRGQAGVRARRRRSIRAMSEARYFLGLAAEQDGRPEKPPTIWRALLADAPADAPWAGFVRESLAARRSDAAAPRRSRGPSADDVAAASEMSPEQRNDDGPRHGGAARRAAQAGRRRRRGLAAAAARLYGAGRHATRRAPPPATRAARWRAIRTSCAGSTN